MPKGYAAIILPTFFVSLAFAVSSMVVKELNWHSASYFILIAVILLGLGEIFGLRVLDSGGRFIKGIFITDAAVVFALVAGALPGVGGIVSACLAVALMLRAILVLTRI